MAATVRIGAETMNDVIMNAVMIGEITIDVITIGVITSAAMTEKMIAEITTGVTMIGEIMTAVMTEVAVVAVVAVSMSAEMIAEEIIATRGGVRGQKAAAVLPSVLEDDKAEIGAEIGYVKAAILSISLGAQSVSNVEIQSLRN